LGEAAASCVSSPRLPKEKEPQLRRTQPLMQRPPVIMVIQYRIKQKEKKKHLPDLLQSESKKEELIEIS